MPSPVPNLTSSLVSTSSLAPRSLALSLYCQIGVVLLFSVGDFLVQRILLDQPSYDDLHFALGLVGGLALLSGLFSRLYWNGGFAPVVTAGFLAILYKPLLVAHLGIGLLLLSAVASFSRVGEWIAVAVITAIFGAMYWAFCKIGSSIRRRPPVVNLPPVAHARSAS